MTSTLQRLERGGYVTIRPDERDSRAKRVAITERGIAARQECVAALQPVLEALRVVVPHARLVEFQPKITALRQALDAERDRHHPRQAAP